MDIKKLIEDFVTKVKNDKDFATNFFNDPTQAIGAVLGINLPKEQISAIVDGVKAKVSLDKAGDLLGQITKLF